MKMSKISWICLGLMIVCIGALVALNFYVLDMTHGCYNAFELTFR